MKTKDLDCLNEGLDYSKFITNNILTIYGTQIDLKDLAIEKYKDLTDITIESCTVLNQDIDFSIFKKLKWLNCSINQLTKYPDLAKCSKLKRLDCNNNQLTSLPDLANCSQLEWLSCTNNQLTTLPDLSNCSQLKWLNCYNNELTSCKSFYNVYNKSSFDISNNPIPQIEVDFVKNVNGIKDYYFDLFNYCVGNNSSYKDFMEIEWPEDFYDNYISKATTFEQKKYMNYITHGGDFNNSNTDLFNF